MAHIGWSWQECMDTQVSFFFAALNMHLQAHLQDRRSHYELIRLQTALLVNTQTRRRITPERLMPFPWDPRPEHRDPMENEVLKKWAANPPRKNISQPQKSQSWESLIKAHKSN